MTDASDFAKQLQAEFAEAMAELRSEVVEVATFAADRLVERSPVRSGQFRASWRASIGAPEFAFAPTGEPPEATKARIAGALAAYAAVEGLPAIYITNGADYASDLEDGRSRQAPQGMVALTVAEMGAAFGGGRK